MFKKILTSTILSLVAIGGFFVSLPVLVEKNNNGIAFISEAHGSNPQTAVAKTQEEAMKEMYNKLVGGINILLDIVTILVSPAIILAGWLMSPDWTSGDIFNLRPTIHRLWIMISNVTYFIYAILLIFIALATIFNSEKYGYKQLLPKLALGIILVPLTWWFVQFIISLSSVVTASVINIPLETVQSYMNSTTVRSTWWESPSIPRNYEFYSDPVTSIIGTPSQYRVSCPDGTEISVNCTSPRDALSGGAGMYSALLIYGNAIFKLNQVKKLDTTLDATKSIVGLVHQTVIAAIMSIIFGLLVLALVFMLMLRAIKLWFYAMFSPIMTLKYVVGDGLFGGKENSESFDLKEFIGLAFVPALVGLALSFGLMIVTLLQTSDPTDTGVSCDVATIMSTGCEIASIMGSPNNRIVRQIEVIGGGDAGAPQLVSVNKVTIGGMTFSFYGQILGTTSDVIATAGSASNQRSVLSVTGGVFGTLIIDIIALIFIWVAFMAAKNVTSIAKTALTPFESFGKKMAGTAKYVPIPFTGGMSANSMGKVGGLMEQKAYKADENRFKESKIGQILGAAGEVSQGDIKTVGDRLKNNKDQAIGEVSSMHKDNLSMLMRNADKYIDNIQEYRDYMKALNEKYGNNPAKIADVLKKNGMNDESAGVIAKYVSVGNYDISSNRDLKSAWAKTATKPGSSTSTGSPTTVVQANFNKDGKTGSVTVGDVSIIVKDGTVSAGEIARLKEGVKEIPTTQEKFKTDLRSKLIQGGLHDEAQVNKIVEQLSEELKGKYQGDKTSPPTGEAKKPN